MKRSSAVPAVLVASLAALCAVGCNNRSRDCVDAQGRVIPDQECVRSTGSHTYPHWVHRSSGTGFFGSSRNANTGSSVGTNGTTSRGGFGNSSGSTSFGG